MISFDYSVVASSPERRGASNVGPWGSPSGVEDAVRSVTFCRTSHFAVIATALAGAAAMPIGAASASAQMNDGTLSGTFAAYGTVKVVASKVLAYDTNGLSVTGGFLNHMTWHCSGLADFRNGTGRAQGFCAGNDPVGDQVVFNWESRGAPAGPEGCERSLQLDRWHREVRRDPRWRNVCGLRGRIPTAS